MSAARTPWRNFVTPSPTTFLLGLEGTTLGAFVRMPSGARAAHLGNLTTGLVTQITGTDRIGRGVRAHTIRLQRWTEGGLPEVCLHPMALAHLFVTEQILRGNIMALLGADDRPAQKRTTLIDRPGEPCDFSQQLGVERFRVTLATTFDIAVHPAQG